MHNSTPSRVIGLFVIGALLVGSSGLFWLLGEGWSQKPYRVMVTFPESVKGLDVGSRVTFQGVRLGSVSSVNVVMNETGQVTIPVILDIKQSLRGDIKETGQDITQTFDLFLKRGLVAQLIPESYLTGLQQIQLSIQPETDGYVLKGSYDYPQIPTIPSQFDKVSNMFEAVASRVQQMPIESIIDNLNNLIATTEQRIASPLVSQSLTDLQVSLHHIASLMTMADNQKEIIYTGITNGLKSLEEAGRDVSESADLVSAFTDELGISLDEIDAVITGVKLTVADFQQLAKPNAPLQRELLSTLRRFDAAAEQFRQLAETLQRNPEAIFSGKQG